MLRIADDGVEVDECIEVPGSADPCVDGLAVGLAEWSGVLVVGARIRRDGGSVDSKAMSVGAFDELLVGGDEAVYEVGVVRGGHFSRAGESAEIVYALEDDDPADSGRSEDVTIEAGESIGAEAVDEEMVAADALIGDGDVSRFWSGLQPRGKDVGPSIVAIGGRAMAVGDGVSQCDNGSCTGNGLHINSRHNVPVVDLSGVGECGSGGEISVCVIGGGSGAGMPSLLRWRLGNIEADSKI
jgi:hypothetical protein